jgi:serine/threonine-protein kinase RsbW
LNWSINSAAGGEIPVVREIGHILREYGETEERIEEIQTAVSEACLNAMEHGNQMDTDKLVRVELHVCPAQWVIRVLDEGRGFRPDAADADGRGRKDGERGWGFMFMRSFADRVETGWERGVFFVQMTFGRREDR